MSPVEWEKEDLRVLFISGFLCLGDVGIFERNGAAEERDTAWPGR